MSLSDIAVVMFCSGAGFTLQGAVGFGMGMLSSPIFILIDPKLVPGPVLAATMLAGRVGSAMAAELGTMRVSEQIEAMRALGANPVRQLVVPRFLACFLLIPLLTLVADAVGILGGWFLSTQVLDINGFFYWEHSREFVTVFDVVTGLVKSVFFGGAIALIACYHGFHCGAGAEGVGRAATISFVCSFVAILAIDFFLGMFLNTVYQLAFPAAPSLV